MHAALPASGEDLDDPADGVGAVEARRGSAQDLDMVDLVERNRFQRRRAAGRRGDAHAVDQDQRLRCVRAPQEDPRSCAGTAVARDLDPGLALQQRHEAVAAALRNLVGADDRHVGNEVDGRLGPARRRDDDRIEHRRALGNLGNLGLRGRRHRDADDQDERTGEWPSRATGSRALQSALHRMLAWVMPWEPRTDIDRHNAGIAMTPAGTGRDHRRVRGHRPCGGAACAPASGNGSPRCGSLSACDARGIAHDAGRSPGLPVLIVPPSRPRHATSGLASTSGRSAPTYRCGGSRGMGAGSISRRTAFPFHPPDR